MRHGHTRTKVDYMTSIFTFPVIFAGAVAFLGASFVNPYALGAVVWSGIILAFQFKNG